VVIEQITALCNVTSSSLGEEIIRLLGFYAMWIGSYRIFSNLIRTVFYSFRVLKYQMRIRFAVESWILEKL